MSRTGYVVGAAAVAVVVVGAAILLRRPEPETPAPKQKSPALERPVAAPEKPTLEPVTAPATVRLLGTMQPGEKATLSVRMPARILSVFATDGGAVRAGQVLIELDAQDFRGQERTAQAGVLAARAQARKATAGKEAQRIKADSDLATAQAGARMAQAKLQQAILGRDAARADLESERKLAQEGVRKAETGLERAKETLRGLEELAKVGGVSRMDLDGARTQVQVSESDLTSAQTQARRLEAGSTEGTPYRVALAQKDVEAAQEGVRQAQQGVRTAQEAKTQILAVADRDIDAANAALQQAQAGATAAREAGDSMRLTSPMAGIATSVTARVGETAQPGMPLLTVVSLNGLHVEAMVTARQLPRLRLAQRARVTADSAPGRTFEAEVSAIARAAEPDGRSFKVQFRFRAAPTALRPGQSVQITLS